MSNKVEDASDIRAIKNSITRGSASQVEKATHSDTKTEARVQKTNITRIGPAAKLLITEYGLDASTLNASGPYGTLLKRDVLSAIKSGKVSKKPASYKEKASTSSQSHQQVVGSHESESHLKQSDTYEDLPNSQIRKVGPLNFQLNMNKVLRVYDSLIPF